MTPVQAGIVASAIVFIVLDWIVVPLRVLARRKVVPQLGAEDWIMIVGHILFTAFCALSIRMVHAGLGDYYQPTQIKDIEVSLMLVFILILLYSVTIAVVRFSIALLLLRLMTNKFQKALVWAILALSTAASIITFGWSLGVCKPIDHYWHFLNQGSCDDVSYMNASFIQSSISILCDWVLAVLPIWVLYKSKLPAMTKFAISAVLAVGILGSAASIGRLMAVARAQKDIATLNLTFSLADVIVCSIVEIGLAIFAGCLATLRPLFIKLKQRTLNALSDGTRGRTGRPVQPGDTLHDWDPGLTIGGDGESRIDTANGSRAEAEEDDDLEDGLFAGGLAEAKGAKSGVVLSGVVVTVPAAVGKGGFLHDDDDDEKKVSMSDDHGGAEKRRDGGVDGKDEGRTRDRSRRSTSRRPSSIDGRRARRGEDRERDRIPLSE